jgi:hypothetical protein
MSPVEAGMSLWRRYFGKGAESRKRDLDAEIEAHLAMAAADARERGLVEEAARHEARRQFGNTALVKDVTRESWGWRWIERLGQDLHYALRQMRKSPAFAATVIGTLALGIGAATAMFTVVDRVLLRPLPYRDAGRLVYINDATHRDNRGSRAFAPYLDIAEWRKWSRSFEGIAFYTPATGRPFIEGETGAEGVGFYKISANLFEVLGTSPALGRDFRDSQDEFAQSADTKSVVISDAV